MIFKCAWVKTCKQKGSNKLYKGFSISFWSVSGIPEPVAVDESTERGYKASKPASVSSGTEVRDCDQISKVQLPLHGCTSDRF